MVFLSPDHREMIFFFLGFNCVPSFSRHRTVWPVVVGNECTRQTRRGTREKGRKNDARTRASETEKSKERWRSFRFALSLCFFVRRVFFSSFFLWLVFSPNSLWTERESRFALKQPLLVAHRAITPSETTTETTQIFSELAGLGPVVPFEDESGGGGRNKPVTGVFPFRTNDDVIEPHAGLRAYPFLGQVRGVFAFLFLLLCCRERLEKGEKRGRVAVGEAEKERRKIEREQSACFASVFSLFSLFSSAAKKKKQDREPSPSFPFLSLEFCPLASLSNLPCR